MKIQYRVPAPLPLSPMVLVPGSSLAEIVQGAAEPIDEFWGTIDNEH